MEITQSELKELLNYNKETGIFTWNKDRGRLAKKDSLAGCHNFRGYIVIKINGKTYRAHRLVFLYINGSMPKDEVDHINHIRDDNRFENLKEANRYDNNRNRRLNKNNKSGTSGVFRLKNKWSAAIRNDDKLINLGNFEKKEDAVKARKDAEYKYKYHKNHGKKS